MLWFFVSDLHGRPERYAALWRAIADERPDAVLLGGDLLPMWMRDEGFFANDLAPGFARLRDDMGAAYPRVFLIFGNDDPRAYEEDALTGEADGLWTYVHERKAGLGGFAVYGYACVPPTPFQLKDWERYDVSRFVDPGCVSPEEGRRSTEVDEHEVRYGTIASDLDALVGDDDLERAVVLCHSPPYGGALDRAALDGKTVDHVPLDVHVGSIALQRFIAAKQPRLTLHGHVHESARLTGEWKETSGRTVSLTAAHDGPELCLVRFDPDDPDAATRGLLT